MGLSTRFRNFGEADFRKFDYVSDKVRYRSHTKINKSYRCHFSKTNSANYQSTVQQQFIFYSDVLEY